MTTEGVTTMGYQGYKLSDGAIAIRGDVAFNYYDRRVGTIGEDQGGGWFDFVQDGRIVSLNGERVCTLETAKRKGWTS